MFNQVRAVPKPKHKRRTKKRVDRGRITPEVYTEVWKRDNGRCVLCKKNSGQAWTIDAHHIVFKSQNGTGDPWNIALACGPATQSGSCHWKAHNTHEGRSAFEQYQREVLFPLYKQGDLSQYKGGRI